jgi:PAS domain S-box-containing protein
MLRARLRLSGAVLLAVLVSGSSSDAQLRPRYVLLLSSFDQQFSPHNVFTAVFRTELTLRSPEPVQFIDVSLPPTKGPRDDAEATLDYLKTTFALHRPDLIVSVGGVAALFAQQHRQQIFPQTPIMFSSVDQRFVRNRTLSPNETAVSVSVDAPRLVDNILHVLPATTTLAVVVGSSPDDLKWRDALMQSFQPFAKRLTFIWLNNLSFEDTLKRCASLPPNSAILFAHLGVDARGVPQVEERALPRLRALANAPIFGVHESQLGLGIVGGPLVPLNELGRSAADIALRILRGESPSSLTPPPLLLASPTFDAAELERWHISEQRLPAGSAIRFRQPSPWERYRAQIVGVASLGVIETALVAGLLVVHLKRKRAERLRQESEERFRLLANSAPVMIWVTDRHRKCTDVNRAWLEFTGRSLDEELGDGWAQGIHHDNRDTIMQALANAWDRREPFRVEYRLRRADGEYRWVLDSGAPRFASDGSFIGYAGSVVDVTELRLAKTALSALSQKLMQAQEEERARVARELHDDACQRVAALTMELEHVMRRLPPDEVTVRYTLAGLSKQSDDLASDLRALSHRLHSSKLELLGLPAAAASFCRDLSQQHRVRIDFTHKGVPEDLAVETEVGLYRVMQEAVMNAVKHSGASRVDVALHANGDGLQLEVVDQGKGFNPEAALMHDGLGLVSMRERLYLIGGELVVQSRPGKGTTVRAHVRNVAPA